MDQGREPGAHEAYYPSVRVQRFEYRAGRCLGRSIQLRQGYILMRSGIRVLRGKLAVRLVLLPVLAFFIVLGAGNAWSALEQAGRAGEISGAVTVGRGGGRQPLKNGDPVFLKDKIQAGAGSSVEIILLDESRVKLAENTMLEVTEYIYKPAEKTRAGLVSIISGKARFLATDLREYRDKRFRVHTRTAVIGSRDTDFIVSYQPGQRDQDNASGDEGGCRDGLVEAFSIENPITAMSRAVPGRPVLLTPNMLVQICGYNPPAPPRFANPAERARLLGGLEKIGNVTTPILGRPHQGSSPQFSDLMGGLGGGGEEGNEGELEDLLGGGARPENPAFGPTASTLTRRGQPIPVTRPTTPTTIIPPTTLPPTNIPRVLPTGRRSSELPGGPGAPGKGGNPASR